MFKILHFSNHVESKSSMIRTDVMHQSLIFSFKRVMQFAEEKTNKHNRMENINISNAHPFNLRCISLLKICLVLNKTLCFFYD